MIYFIYGNQSPTIKSRIKKIAKETLSESGIDDFNFVKLDGNNSLVQDVIDECNYLSLGCDKKVVSVENCYFLLKPKPKNKIDADQDFDAFASYIENPNPDTDLIVSVVSSELDSKNKIVSLLKEKASVMPIVDPNETDWLSYCKLCFEKAGSKIDKDALQEVAVRTGSDVALLHNTVAKLALYSDHITYDDVALMVAKPLEENAFQIFNLLLDKRNAEAVGLFRDLKTSNVEPVTIVSLLAGQYLLLNQVTYLVKQGYSKEDIATKLNIKPGRAYILSKYTHVISEKALNRTLEDLYKLDYEIKSGLVDRFNAFEIFLLNCKTN